MRLAAGKVAECPFSDKLVNEGRELLFLALEYAGATLPVRERPEGQPLFLAAIEEVLRISRDPDYAAFYTSDHSFAKGVKLGVDVELPRVQAQFQEEEKLGAMIQLPMQEASKRYGERLRFASLGAIEKKDGTYRVTHDATHGVGVNSAIQLKDQVRYPTAGDLRTAIMILPRAFFGLTGDVKRAHRLVKLAEEDWGYTACRTGAQSKDMLWLNTVGTFGVSSIAFHWCRLMGGMGRAAYYLIACLEVLRMVYSDDLFWVTQDTANGVDYIVLQVFFYVILGVPFSWKKFCGGVEFSWVGFTLSIKKRALGISASRASWLVSWLRKTACEKWVKIADLQAVMGRLSFALTALGHLRPFLGPLYAWLAVARAQRVGQLPKAVVYIMLFLASALEGHGRLLPVWDVCPPRSVSCSEQMRTRKAMRSGSAGGR
ncbi:unnamed protein product [Symbiodinium natans]|uniref:Uncharacterized protein n=1 Tax=Symbiodinium natans TaxID=878477 RepID=A0A812JI07_9DINO|nr:unnamed protein product [Symbiodinium natans]